MCSLKCVSAYSLCSYVENGKTSAKHAASPHYLHATNIAGRTIGCRYLDEARATSRDSATIAGETEAHVCVLQSVKLRACSTPTHAVHEYYCNCGDISINQIGVQCGWFDPSGRKLWTNIINKPTTVRFVLYPFITCTHTWTTWMSENKNPPKRACAWCRIYRQPLFKGSLCSWSALCKRPSNRGHHPSTKEHHVDNRRLWKNSNMSDGMDYAERDFFLSILIAHYVYLQFPWLCPHLDEKIVRNIVVRGRDGAGGAQPHARVAMEMLVLCAGTTPTDNTDRALHGQHFH